jgi:two-component system, NtrC family, response regulator AtoC
MNKTPVLIVEDDKALAKTVERVLSREGYDVTVVMDGKAAEAALAQRPFNIALLDLGLPDTTGHILLEKWVQTFPELQVIVLTADREMATAVKCVKTGAFDFLVKPAGQEQLLKTVEGAVRHLNLTKRVSVLTQLAKREAPTELTGIIAEAPAMRRTLDMARRIAGSDYSCVLLRGESGVGKGLLARAIHKMSQRCEGAFVEVNCSAMPATLVESELFGHKRGSFTDAKEDRIGVFEMADGGSLFLDEIGDMEVSLQAKLLKVIEEQRFRRIGGTTEVTVSVAVIAATNQDIPKRVTDGGFRSDLFYRLNVVPLEIPPLRERLADIPALAAHFLALYARRFGKHITGFSSGAEVALKAYAWPGNVRELRNVVERACLLAQHETIDVPDLLLQGDAPAKSSTPPFALPPMPLAQAEELAIRAALEAANGNRNVAAEILRIHRTTLYKKLREYGIAGDTGNEDSGGNPSVVSEQPPRPDRR